MKNPKRQTIYIIKTVEEGIDYEITFSVPVHTDRDEEVKALYEVYHTLGVSLLNYLAIIDGLPGVGTFAGFSLLDKAIQEALKSYTEILSDRHKVSEIIQLMNDLRSLTSEEIQERVNRILFGEYKIKVE